jgi:hypothetical protein
MYMMMYMCAYRYQVLYGRVPTDRSIEYGYEDHDDADDNNGDDDDERIPS